MLLLVVGALTGCNSGLLDGVAGAIPGGSQISGASKQVREGLNAAKQGVETAASAARVYESLKDPMEKGAVASATSRDAACAIARARLPENGPCEGAPASRTLQDCVCTVANDNHVCRAAAVFACQPKADAIAAPVAAVVPAPLRPSAPLREQPHASAPAPEPAAACTKDIECKGDRICVNGQCSAPEAAPLKAPRSPPVAAVAPARDVPQLRPMPATSRLCAGGKMITEDTQGHCCWEGQVWSNRRCVGAPTSCPAEYEVDSAKQDCALRACPSGQTRKDNGLHCCWPGQGWSSSRSRCIGAPTCPTGFERADAETCVSEDKDGDGIANKLDKCPDQPEDKNDFEDDDGCPDGDRRFAAMLLIQEKVKAEEEAREAENRRKEREEEEREKEARRLKTKQREREQEAREEAEEEQRAQEDEAAKSGRRRIGVIVGGAGLGAGALGTIFLALASSQQSKITSGGLGTASDIEDAASTGKTFNTLGGVAIAAGLIGLGIGLPLYFGNLPTKQQEASVELVPGGAVLSARWTR